MKITKELYKKCRNELGQAFDFLNQETQEALKELKSLGFVCVLTEAGWEEKESDKILFSASVYRVSDSYTFAEERETIDEDVVIFQGTETKYYGIYNGYGLSIVSDWLCFVGIGYEKDGVITLRTSVDAAFGTPKFVRLYKED